MRKRVFGKNLSRDRGARHALFRSLTLALIEHGSIRITKAKAKAIQADIDWLVTEAKKSSITSRRKIFSFLANNRVATEKLFGIVKDRFSAQNSGFTKITNLPQRFGDNARVVKFEWSKEAKNTKEGKSDDAKGDKEGEETKAKSLPTGKRSLKDKLGILRRKKTTKVLK
jgi:large subunit ribosomal protein L17